MTSQLETRLDSRCDRVNPGNPAVCIDNITRQVETKISAGEKKQFSNTAGGRNNTRPMEEVSSLGWKNSDRLLIYPSRTLKRFFPM